MPLARGSALERPAPYIERDGRFWQVTIPAGLEDGMDMCLGPIFTKWGARLSLWFHNWCEGRRYGS